MESDIDKFDDMSFQFEVLKARLDKATEDCKLVNHRESLVNARSTDFR